jgi:hypothetical protein
MFLDNLIDESAAMIVLRDAQGWCHDCNYFTDEKAKPTTENSSDNITLPRLLSSSIVSRVSLLTSTISVMRKQMATSFVSLSIPEEK